MTRKNVIAISLTALISSPAAFAADLPGKGVTVSPVQSTLPEESFQTELINRALEKLGYEVKPTEEVDYNVAYTAIAAGDATYMAVNWEPLQNDMYNAAGGDGKFYRKGTYISGAAQGYLIDKKTADKYHITDISQLKDPKLAKLFDANNDGKADLAGCNPGWVCGQVINAQISAYGLSNTVQQNQGNYSAIIADTLTRYKAGKPVLYFTWTPYWVSDELKPGRDVVWLTVPFSATPGSQKNEDTALPNGKNYGFKANNEHVVANKAWAEKNPAAAKLFSIVKLPLNDVNAQNQRMHAGESSSEDIQRHVDGWIHAHQATFDGWVKEAAAAK
ncbi:MULTISPECIES: glycine betaine/L-proline ABC transporter substrate-binding protein ProX [unclassified Pantoea]|uniref:glycine betaine/L-proline ABC transporter substrate-binding protein ProX n=1 Tax=unclassified Pantoea TaxID=2630326 RepID=UPI001CD2CBDA|nr:MULTISPECIES: glycine betaine/L-proline ABC transporter substrate-binding protein ProX [unclassified Pantoea]MCA1177538.1 glycine betaine/L-proline ABC transporter substrate-binding protein ProX [Pantoea sp. alder69]MCA1249556.1 glycine betaine/L-proline ABC transporter substrate-binding protein ProX [Pantoea sp. alder70]MCA1266027.1 glycine betaine/L-proline ABC transporter substrate-binding protein ProX [Pantoea sp. alder81]